jgi:hypothetical protein
MRTERGVIAAALLGILAGSLPPQGQPATPEWMRDADSEPQSEDSRQTMLQMAEKKRGRKRERNRQRGSLG